MKNFNYNPFVSKWSLVSVLIWGNLFRFLLLPLINNQHYFLSVLPAAFFWCVLSDSECLCWCSTSPQTCSRSLSVVGTTSCSELTQCESFCCPLRLHLWWFTPTYVFLVPHRNSSRNNVLENHKNARWRSGPKSDEDVHVFVYRNRRILCIFLLFSLIFIF